MAIISRRQLTAVFVTDDAGAQNLAGQMGIPVLTTWHLFKLSRRAGLLDLPHTLAALAVLLQNHRGFPPCDPGVSAFETWLEQP